MVGLDGRVWLAREKMPPTRLGIYKDTRARELVEFGNFGMRHLYHTTTGKAIIKFGVKKYLWHWLQGLTAETIAFSYVMGYWGWWWWTIDRYMLHQNTHSIYSFLDFVALCCVALCTFKQSVHFTYKSCVSYNSTTLIWLCNVSEICNLPNLDE